MSVSALVDSFDRARWYTPNRSGVVRLVVVHSMEVPEKGDSAERTAYYFATLPRSRVVAGRRIDARASAHYCVDSDSIVGCVDEGDVGYHAPGANHDGIGIEHAGYARQTAEEWTDTYGMAMLRRSARLCADVCRRHRLPPHWLDPAGLLAGRRGITSHHAVTLAYGRSTHTDPGPAFPHDLYVRLVVEALAPPPLGGDMPAAKDTTAVVACPTGGYWRVEADGGVFAHDGAPYFGSRFTLPPEQQRFDEGEFFVGLAPLTGTAGYVLVTNRGDRYTFTR